MKIMNLNTCIFKISIYLFYFKLYLFIIHNRYYILLEYCMTNLILFILLYFDIFTIVSRTN